MMLINFFLAQLLFIPYHLALAYIGISSSLKRTLLPCFLLGLIAFIIKILLDASPIIHTISIMLVCALLLHFFNKIDLLLSATGSLLSFITFILGSLLIACPVLVSLGFEITKKTTGMEWIILNIAEFAVPSLVLVFLRAFKISPMKHLTIL